MFATSMRLIGAYMTLPVSAPGPLSAAWDTADRCQAKANQIYDLAKGFGVTLVGDACGRSCDSSFYLSRLVNWKQ